ncbi:hypothetical protein C2S51_026673 [Perilla frutescens var. frutescens]|nr:hypothetical protein C2S51_026673 [Perilla frutescens var. frutescens]
MGFDFDESELDTEATMRELYERWSIHHQHHLMNHSTEEKEKRFKAFKGNAHYVNSVNKLRKPYTLGLNKFADMTVDEFNLVNGRCMAPKSNDRGANRTWAFSFMDAQPLPPSIDWREKGAVTSVKQQGKCRSCWAFAAAAAVEGINFITTKQLVSVSAQQILDCTSPIFDCKVGGRSDVAFSFIQHNQGITTNERYSYMEKKGACSHEKYSPVVTIDGYERVPSNDEDALQRAVAHQPVAVAVDSNSNNFQLYAGGVLVEGCGTNPDHQVTIVGYGTTSDGTKFWIIKNSWGTNWGEGGYMRLKRGIDSKEGLCGITKVANYPIKIQPK